MSALRRLVFLPAIFALLVSGCVTDGLSVSFGDIAGAGTAGDVNGGVNTVNGTSSTGSAGGSSTNSSGSNTGGTSQADQVIVLVNSERSKAGLGPLAANSLLTAAAAIHADDMAANGFFSHTGSDNSSAAERVTRAGYAWSAVGENIASGATSAQQAMELWMNSSGHRANILNPDFTEIGVAVDTRGGLLWVQDFGRPQ